MTDTMNKFLVGIDSGGSVRILNNAKLILGIQREDSLNLAAWIVALVDPNGKRFQEILQAVKNS